MPLRATEVFTPGTFPEYTYIQRDDLKLEQKLGDALSTEGQVVSLSGPSKSGKTVLIEQVVGKDLLIPVSGASIKHPDDLWTLALDWMDAPDSTTTTESLDGTIGGELSGSGSLGTLFLAKTEVSAKGKAEATLGAAAAQVKNRRGMQQVVKEIARSAFVLLVDDFHYMSREVQSEVAKSIKEATRLHVKIVTASVSHRGDDVVRANSELRGRVHAIDLDYWKLGELEQIAVSGFGRLNGALSAEANKSLAVEAAGSPQLMQSICLQLCFVENLRAEHEGPIPKALLSNGDILKQTLEQTSSATDFRSLVDVLDSGPRTRGTERKTYKFSDGSSGDVYTAVLKAVAEDPPRLQFSYDDLQARTAAICVGESPVGSSITGTCAQMAKLALERFPNERTIDWDEAKFLLDIPDPYLMFYLRWSGRMRNTL